MLAANIEKGIYDDRDLEKLRTDDEYLNGFIKSFFKHRDARSDMNNVLAKLDKVLTFRKTTGLNGKLIDIDCICDNLISELLQ